MDFGTEFGKAMRRLVGKYFTTSVWVALIWHVSTLAKLHLTLRCANRCRRVFS